jgi:glyoxylase-like metal-dependent hydrolase (beta-lactamase superfamily II)
VQVDRQLKDGQQVAWHEYRLDIVHLPGQTEFTMGVGFTVDGKKCFHTGDNFYHADQFTGSGGWSGANRGWPLPFAASARELLGRQPDWVLIEHGGPIEFVAEDFRRRADWLEAAAKAADALSPSGNHRVDWDLQRIRVEPLLTRAKAGQTATAKLAVSNPGDAERKLQVALDGRGIIKNLTFDVSIAAKTSVEHELRLSIADKVAPGRHVFPLVITEGDVEDGADTFFVLDISP